MRKTTLYLDEATAIALRQTAQAEGRSQAEIVREAVARYTAAASRPRPVGVGKYRSRRGDVAARDEELLRRRIRARGRL